MLSYYWDAKNQVLPRQGEIDMNGLKAMIALPAPERFVDLRYAKTAGVE